MFAGLFLVVVLSACDNTQAQKGDEQAQKKTNPYYSHTDTTKLNLSDAEWKKILSPGLYHIAREAGTDCAFQSGYHDNHAAGMYYCAACGNPLFSSNTKFESGSGWPSFYKALHASKSVVELRDKDGERTEFRCARCGSHLGHVFDDGPNPTGLRYCTNGTSLDFVPAK